MKQDKELILSGINSIYLMEIVSLSNMIIKDCESIFTDLKPPEQDMYLNVDPDKQYLINSIIVNCSNLKKIFKPKAIKSKYDSKALFEKRIERGKYFDELFNFDQFKTMNSSSVRNSIEHFDERIDKVFVNVLHNNESITKYPLLLYNITLSTRSVFTPEPYYLRCYIIDEKVAYIDNKGINIGNLYIEANAIRSKAYDFIAPENTGGLLTRL